MDWANSLPRNIIVKKKNEAENLFKKIGITFSVYNNFDTSERLIPFDMFPRILTSLEWKRISRGILQRSIAINAFINDIYHSAEIIKAKIIPEKLIYNNPAYEIKMVGFKVPKNIYSPIIGTDIIRTNEKDFKVLEDNCRTPSGVSYMIENRDTMMKLFPDLFSKYAVTDNRDYPSKLSKILKNCSPLKRKKEAKWPGLTALTEYPKTPAFAPETERGFETTPFALPYEVRKEGKPPRYTTLQRCQWVCQRPPRPFPRDEVEACLCVPTDAMRAAALEAREAERAAAASQSRRD